MSKRAELIAELTERNATKNPACPAYYRKKYGAGWYTLKNLKTHFPGAFAKYIRTAANTGEIVVHEDKRHPSKPLFIRLNEPLLRLMGVTKETEILRYFLIGNKLVLEVGS